MFVEAGSVAAEVEGMAKAERVAAKVWVLKGEAGAEMAAAAAAAVVTVRVGGPM